MTKKVIFASMIAATTALSIATAGSLSHKGDWVMWGGTPDRNMVSGEKNIPAFFAKFDPSKSMEENVKAHPKIKWYAPMGSQTYGNPIVADGKVLVGTNNNGEFRPGIKGDKGVIVCLEEATGKFLWQATHDKLPTGRVNDWPEQGICSTAFVEGDKIYYVSNRAEVVCADLNGFLDGENDGPWKKEKYNEKQDADILWMFDMIEETGAFPHNLATSSPVCDDERLYVLTSNGVDEGHLNLPADFAPSFIALDKKTGELVWAADDPGENILHGQWSSPALGTIGGVPQVICAGGDGVCYSYAPDSGDLLWKFDLNPKDSVWELGGRGTRNNIISTPVIHDNKVYLAVGQDPEHGEGVGHLYAIDGTKRGDITKTGAIWHFGDDDFNRTMSTCAIADGLLYISDLSGYLYCLDVKTGKQIWRYDLKAAVWGSPIVVDGKVFIGDEDGDIHVVAHGRELKELAMNELMNSVYTTPTIANGVMYISNRRYVYAIAN